MATKPVHDGSAAVPSGHGPPHGAPPVPWLGQAYLPACLPGLPACLVRAGLPDLVDVPGRAWSTCSARALTWHYST